MKNKTLFALVCAFTLAAAAFPAAARDKKADEIIRQMDIAEGYRSAYMEYDQIITTSSGAKRTLEIRSWGVVNGDRQLAEYLAPADIKGQKILMTDDGDNIWMFNAETRRTRKLGSHMKKKKVMGSDFTYEDQAGGKISEKYTGVMVGEENEGSEDCYVLDLTPTPEGPSYDKIRVWVAKKDFVTRRVDYYRDGQDKPFKRLISGDIRKVDYQDNNKPAVKIVPFSTVMKNLEDRTETVNIIKSVSYGVKIPDFVFNPRKLDS